MSGVELKNVYSYETGSTLITRNEYYKNGESQEYYTYTYDDAGNIKTISKDGVLQKSYNYDKLGQLETEYNYDTLKYYQYEYDYGGNITRKITLNILYSPENGITGMSYAGERSYVYGDETWGDLLTNYNGQTITYDAIGNPLQYYGGRSFTWSNGRQLTSLQNGNDVVSYTYNADGLRNTKTVNGVTTQYYYDDSGRLICLKNATDELWLYYDLGTSPTSMRHNGTRYLFLKNIQGDVTAIVNSAGTVMARYTYDSWGTVLSITDGNGNSIVNNPNHIGNINPIRYRGYYYDTESSLYYLNSRYYDPNTGRFINVDSAYDTNQGILGYNMYLYCLDNPINMQDPDGECGRFLWILWKVDCNQASCPNSKNYIKPKEIDPIGSYNNGKGYVYVVSEDQLSIMEDREKNVVVIVDKRTSSDPNMQIQDSYKISKTRQQKEIAQLMIDYNTSNPVNPAWSRTLNSLVSEWMFHNFAYSLGYKRERTADCDFNNDDEGKGFWDFVWR